MLSAGSFSLLLAALFMASTAYSLVLNPSPFNISDSQLSALLFNSSQTEHIPAFNLTQWSSDPQDDDSNNQTLSTIPSYQHGIQLWNAVFHKSHEYVKSDPITLDGPTASLYRLWWQSTQPISIVAFQKSPGHRGWQPSMITPPKGSASGVHGWIASAGKQLSFDVEVPQLPEGIEVKGAVGFEMFPPSTAVS